MARSQRLLDLIQVLRRHRRPVSGRELAVELGISLRTLYRDIATLQAQGAAIEGEAGLGYVLRPGFLLPPLMFSDDEIEALVLGSRWVAAGRADDRLVLAARNALAKIAAVLPDGLREELDASALLVASSDPVGVQVDLALVRRAIRTGRKLDITYRDEKAAETRRTIWPFALAFFERTRVIVAWCELRQAFRHFRADRIVGMVPTEARYPRRRQVLLKEWRAFQDIDALSGL